MKGLPRTIVNVLIAISLFFCALTAGLWGRSYWREFMYGFDAAVTPPDPGPVVYNFTVGSGLLTIEETIGTGSKTPRPLGYSNQPVDPKANDPDTFMGFSYFHVEGSGIYTQIIPCWFLVFIFALFPAIVILLRLYRPAPIYRTGGLCMNCGYDLRAAPPRGRCPECGTPRLRRIFFY